MFHLLCTFNSSRFFMDFPVKSAIDTKFCKQQGSFDSFLPSHAQHFDHLLSKISNSRGSSRSCLGERTISQVYLL